jgi:hypothetical protein
MARANYASSCQHYPGIQVLGVVGCGGAAIPVEAKYRHLLLHIGQCQDFRNFSIDSDGLPTGAFSPRGLLEHRLALR